MLTPYRSGRKIARKGEYTTIREYRSILAQTCSTRCEQRYRRKLKRERRPGTVCTICGTTFRPNGADAKFCSNACRPMGLPTTERKVTRSVTSPAGFKPRAP